MYQNYVLGFCFSPDMREVVLIEKNKPEWQKGHLNGVGGKIEENETPSYAMQREFMEETGVVIPANDWICFGSLKGEDFCVMLYKTLSERYIECETKETEKVGRYLSFSIHELNVIPNLHWIVPACLVNDFKSLDVSYFLN